MVRPARRSAGNRHLGGIRLERIGKLLDGLDRRLRRDHEREKFTGQPGDRHRLENLTGLLLAMIAPTITMPETISALPCPFH